MRKKFNILLIFMLTLTVSVFGLFACGDGETNGNNDSGNVDAQILKVYNLYVASAKESGETPLTYEEWIVSIKGENGKDGTDGIDGINGKDGVSIVKIEKTSTEGITDTYTITYSDGNTFEFTITNGANGTNGKDGVNGKDGINGTNGISPQVRVNINTNLWEVSYDNGTTWTSLGVKATGEKGADGINGIDGKDGADGINGKDGINGEDGKTPHLRINADSNLWEVSYDNGITWTSLGVKATGEKGANGINGTNGLDGKNGLNGKDGADGKSAYEIYKEKYGYEKSEEEWLYDLVNGNLSLKEKYTVSFDSDGGTEIAEQIIADGKKAAKPVDPEKEGCVFNGWFVGDEQWNFLSCVVTENTVLKAKWVEISFDTTAGDKSEIGVETENNEITLTANHKAGYTWLGWYAGDEKVSKGNSYSVTFNQSESDRVYTAKFAKITVKQNVADAGSITQLNGKYFYGDTAVVSATVKSGYVFKGWYKNGVKVSEDGALDCEIVFGTENETYTATYIANPVSITKNVSAAGTVEKQAIGIIGGDYTITATTNDGYTWLGWYSGGEKVSVGDSLTYTFALTETPITYTAQWAEYKITLSKNYDKAGTLSGSGSKAAGSNATVKATNDYSEYFTFDGWYSGSERVSSSANYTFEMPSNSLSLTAKWNLKSGVEAITTASQLNAIDGTKTYILLNDINYSNNKLPQIKLLSGTLDGLGYKIYNALGLSAGYMDNYLGYGLFLGNNGIIKNLRLQNIKAEIKTVGGYIGTIAYENNGIIQNCEVKAELLTTANCYSDVGGVVCKNSGTIESC